MLNLSRSERRRLTVFFSCLFIAFITWLSVSLTGKYTYQVSTKVGYVDPPENKAFHPLQEDSVTMQVEGTGWQLLFDRLRFSPREINVSLRSLNIRNYVVFSSQLKDINRQFDSHQKVIYVSPDTLFFDFSKRKMKKVPVRFVYDLSFKKNYGISGPIKLSPRYVIINGAEEDLRKINEWPTSRLVMQDVNADITARVGLAVAREGNIDIYPQHVRADIPVDVFSEKEIEVPIKVLNTRGRDVKLLPEKAKVVVLASLNRYPAIERDSFVVSVDLQKWMQHGYRQLPLVINKYPAFSKMVRVEPQVVDFYIK